MSIRRILIVLTFLIAGALVASERGLPIMNIYGADVHQGGPQTFEIAQDARGVLYFGTLRGLLMYDGAWWRLIQLPDEQATLTVESNARGVVALGLVNDFGFLTPDASGNPTFRSLRHLLSPNQRNFGDVRGLCSTSYGFLFVTENNVMLWDGQKVHLVSQHGKDGPRDCRAEAGQVLLRGPTGLQRFNEKTLHLESTRVNRPITAMVTDANNTLIVAVRDGGLYSVGSNGELQPYAPIASEWLKTRPITGAARLHDGRLVFSTRQHELLVLDRSGAIDQIIGDDAGLPDAITQDVLVDQEGALWVAMEGPLVRLDLAAPVSVYDARRGMKGTPADVTRFGNQVYVAGTHGVFVLGVDGRAQHLPGLSEGAWRLLVVDDELLIGTVKGIYRKRSGSAPELLFELDSVTDLARSTSDNNRVWAATSEGLVTLRREGATWTAQPVAAGISEVASVVEQYGTVWCGSVFNGLVRLENPLSAQPRMTQFGTGEINVHVVDGRIMAVRASDGAFLQPVDDMTEARNTHELIPDPLLGHLSVPGGFFAVAQDSRGNLWLNSTPPRVVLRRTDGRFSEEPQPLPTVHSTDIQNLRTERSGLVWFATDRGLFRYDPATMPQAVSQPRPLIRRVTTRAVDVLFGGEGAAGARRLAHDFGRIRIEFAPASYSAGVVYQYRLDPADSEWSSWTNVPSIDYTTLTPSAYTFRLRARNPMSDPSAETKWAFAVVPPWYRTWWASALWLVLAATAIVAGIRFRTRSLRRHGEWLRARVDEQTVKLQETVSLLEQSNHDLQEAQEKIAAFNESSGEALRDVRSWSCETAADLAITIHASQILVFIASNADLVPLTTTDVRPPRLDDLEAIPHRHTPLTTPEGHTILAVPGLTGRVFGALTVVGKATTWTESERQLLSTFAHQLGGALELQQVRNDLAEARERNLAARRQMTERGIALLHLCPACSRCFDDQTPSCPDDRSVLDASRILPYRIAARYRLVRLLGSGGMGEVFAARDERLERDVAVKVIKSGQLDADVASRFEREARAVARIHHENVVAIYDSGELEEGSAYLVTELLDGCDLNYILRRHGRGTPQQVASLLRQGAAALEAAHAAGLVHRDIKPANLFLVNGPTSFDLKLVDFGIAKAMDIEAQLTHSGTLIGTPAYMAPEQITRGRADAKSDLYSFAAVAYEALAGVRVSGHASGFAALWDVMSVEVPPPSKVRPGLTATIDAAFAAALAKDPAMRPADVQAWVEPLAAALDRIPASEPGWPHPLVRERLPQYGTVAMELGSRSIAPTIPNPA